MSTRDIAIGLFIVLLWGVNFVVMKHAVSELPPFLLTALRFALAAVPAVFLVARPNTPWAILIAFGLAFGVVKFGFLFFAFDKGMPSGLAAVVLQTQVLFTVLLASLILGERTTAAQRIGVGLACLGVAVIAFAVLGQSGASRVGVLPILLTVAAAVAWAFANIVIKRAGRIDALAFAVWTSAVVPIPMFLASLVFEGPTVISNALMGLTWTGAAAVAYLAYPVSLLSGALWAGLLSRHQTASVAPFALLVPVVGLFAGWLVYGEAISVLTSGGIALVALGLVVNVVSTRRTLAPAGTAQPLQSGTGPA